MCCLESNDKRLEKGIKSIERKTAQHLFRLLVYSLVVFFLNYFINVFTSKDHATKMNADELFY